MEQIDTQALLLCPFCGHPPVHRQILNDGRWIIDCHTVACIRPTTEKRPSEAESIAAWNTRTAHSATAGEVVAWMTDEGPKLGKRFYAIPTCGGDGRQAVPLYAHPASDVVGELVKVAKAAVDQYMYRTRSDEMDDLMADLQKALAKQEGTHD